MATGDKIVNLDDLKAVHDFTQGQVSDLKSAIEEISETTIVPGTNLFDKSEVVVGGGFFNTSNGNIATNSAHGYLEQYIPVSEKFIISNDGTSPLTGLGLRVIYYNNQKAFLSGEQISTGNHYNSTFNRCYVVITPPENTAYIRFSTSMWGTGYTDKSIMVERGETESDYVSYNPDVEKTTVKDAVLPDTAKLSASLAYQISAHTAKISMPTVGASSLSDGQKIEISAINFHTQKTYSFYAEITSFSGVKVGNAEAYDGTWVEVDDTNVYVKRKLSDVATNYTYEHGLTIKTYILIVTSVNALGRATITIATDGGVYRKDNLGYEGRNGNIEAVSLGSSFGNCVLSYASNGYRAKVWAIGDSYLSNANNARWGYYLVNWGYTGYAFIGYPGEASEAGYNDFLRCLQNGCPKYAIWAHGMNNPDSDSAINSTWLEYTEDFLDTCNTYGITPILATIPNTPNHTNTFKNAWIKASGYRYIDFAKAVGAESAGSTWYSGMLSVDNVHPDVEGAVALAAAAITECPELQLSL